VSLVRARLLQARYPHPPPTPLPLHSGLNSLDCACRACAMCVVSCRACPVCVCVCVCVAYRSEVSTQAREEAPVRGLHDRILPRWAALQAGPPQVRTAQAERRRSQQPIAIAHAHSGGVPQVRRRRPQGCQLPRRPTRTLSLFFLRRPITAAPLTLLLLLLFGRQQPDMSQPRGPPRPLESVTCFKCGQMGHYANKVPTALLTLCSPCHVIVRIPLTLARHRHACSVPTSASIPRQAGTRCPRVALQAAAVVAAERPTPTALTTWPWNESCAG
jgi:hypothetical protein